VAHYHFTVKTVSRTGGKSAVAKLAYRSATDLNDLRTGEVHTFSSRQDVFHVDILLPEGAPQWIVDISRELKTNRQSALQKLSDIFEATEKRINSRVYREAEFALPNELTNEQNIEWSKGFVRDFFCKKGMVAIVNYHGEVDEKTGIYKPHCHVLLSTRNLAEHGFSTHKNRRWDSVELLEEWREQFANYQNAALKEHGFDTRVTHLSYEDMELDIDPQTKLGQNVREMTARGIETDKQKIFDMVRLKNQFKIIKNPEIVFSIVTANHSTFTRKDIAKVLHRYIDDATQFQVLYDRLMNSKELVDLESLGIHKQTDASGTGERVYTTQEMLRIEMNLVQKAETLAAQESHPVSSKIIEKVIAKFNQKHQKHGGLSTDQQAAIRHMLSPDQISCVVGFAGAGKTTCLEAVREAWEEAGYRIIGLAPTGKSAQNIEGCGIRSMTIHKFLYAQKDGREKLTPKTIVVGDEFGMVDSRRCSKLLSLINQSGAKIVPMGDGHQAQSVEAGPAFRLLTDRIKPVVLEKVVRQQIEWQREATRLFGILQTRKALETYQENGCFTTVEEKTPDFTDKGHLVDNFCLARQMSGRIWKEMMADFEAEFGTGAPGTDESGTGAPGKSIKFNPETDFEILAKHQDFPLFQQWKSIRETLVLLLINDYDNQQEQLKERGVDVISLDDLVTAYKETLEPDPAIFEQIETTLRQMSYKHIVDSRENTRQALVDAWAKDIQTSPEQSHLMLAFTIKDANKLNEVARTFMREQGKIQGKDYEFVTQRIQTDEFGVESKTYHNRTFANGDRILFTRNNNSLEVKNGSLGTILEISKSKMTVALDTVGGGQKTLSFSPNLYPFIDNGWATTIIKAQGVTVDHVKLLASFEQYRNLAYVGMSRHRLPLHVFGSNLDFWREEKIIDRLSRVQEKLSGLDYLDTDKIQEKLKEDTAILWHLQKMNQAKDFWTAIKFTAWDVLGKAFGRPQESKIEDEEFQSFDDTEEVRSRDFFKVPSDTRGKGAFAGVGSDPKGSEEEVGRKEKGKERNSTKAPNPKNSQSESDVEIYSDTKGGLDTYSSTASLLPFHVGQKNGEVILPPAIDLDKLKNQSKILKNPEIILDIVTNKHSTFTKKDIARVLNDHIENLTLFQILYDRLSNSKELVNLEGPSSQGPVGQEPVFTTRKMLQIEMNLIKQAEEFSARKTHPVEPHIIESVIARFNKRFEEHGGLSPDQQQAIRHMLSGEQISCVIGFGGAGKTTCLEAVKEAWEEAGYTVLGLAPTGKAERSIAECGIRSMTVHKFLKACEKHEQKGEGQDQFLNPKTIVIVDEAGMVDSRRFEKLQSLVGEAESKIVPVGDNNQLQSVEAGPAYRLVCSKVKTVALETVVRQRVPWQREATRFFGLLQPRRALALYHQHGAFETISESMPNPKNPNHLIDAFCLARQVSERIWKEMAEDYKAAFGRPINFDEEGTFENVLKHKDFDLYVEWRDRRRDAVEAIIQNFDSQKSNLEQTRLGKLGGVHIQKLEALVSDYKIACPEDQGAAFGEIEKILRKISYRNIYDTRIHAKQVLVSAWAADLNAIPHQSHLMLAFTNRDANTLNESARLLMREKGMLIGADYPFKTKYIEEDYFGNTEVLYEERKFAQGDRILFTRNNEGLGVRNGTLGTVLSLNQENITVLLDGKEKQELSFSPTAYPFIDNGWATTIHKAQSANVDHVKKLASYEEYRNLAYVGMTRHRHTLKVYASDLDFWREEKIFDRLSRVQEKLSGFDYLNEGAVIEKLASEASPDHQTNLSEERAERHFWDALKKAGEAAFVDAGDISKSKSQGFDSISEGSDPASKSSPEPDPIKTDFLDEDYLSLEDSEEKRSADIFKDPFDIRGKEAFSGEGEGKRDGTGGDTTRQKGQGRSSSRSQKKQEGNQDGKQEGPLNSSDSATQTQQSRAHTEQQDQESSGQQARQQKRNESFTHKDQAVEVGDQDKQRYGEDKDKSYSSSPPDLGSSPQPSSSQPSPNPSVSKDDEFKKKLEAIKDKIKGDYATKIVIKEKFLPFEEVDRQLKERIYELATSIFGEPNKGSRNSAYLRFGKADKFSVGVRGKHHGIYTNFVTNISGGPLKLIQDQMGYSSSKEALAWARNWLGGQEVTARPLILKREEKYDDKKLDWKPIVPVPKNVPGPDVGKCLYYMLKEGYQEVVRHVYRDEQGNLKGYVVRLEKRDGDTVDKKTLPLSWGRDARGSPYWKSKAFYEEENRTPYGVEKLAQDQGKPVGKPILVVEGEKTADKAQKDFPGYHVLTWVGGAGAVGKTSWACLSGKDVTIWPDYDYNQGGQKAAQKLQQIIIQLNKDAGKEGRVGVVELPDTLREGPEPLKDGWDLADPLPKSWTLSTVEQMIKEALPQQDKDKEVSDQRQDTYKETKTSFSQKDTFFEKREAFEKSRLPINQEWCAHLGFFVQHKRFPNKGKEIAAAWWQGERLTTIEGRLYRETLQRKEEPDEKQLTLDARTELAKNQKAPAHIMTLGKSSDLDKVQLKQFEQHVLIHQDKTGQLPKPSDLDTLCQAIKVRSQIMEAEGGDNRIDRQGAITTKTPEPRPGEKTSEKTPDTKPDIYRTLIEQQAVLARIKGDGLNNLARNEMSKDMVAALHIHDIRDSCSERLDRLDAKIETVREFSQDMKTLERNRQKQRGIEM